MKIINSFAKFILDLYASRNLIFQLTIRDFKTRYVGSYLGFLWAFIQPVVIIVLLIFVFKFGLRGNKPVGSGHSFELWLITGLIPWFYFTEALTTATNSIIEHPYLVKKVVFRVSMLPIVKILTAFLIHAFFIFFIFVVFAIYGHMPHLYNLQVFYYFFCATVLLLGLSWITSSLVIFLKDVNQIILMIIQFGFWLTPLIWPIKMLPPKFKFLIKLNPVVYITEGYRESFIYKVWFWEHWKFSIYFWCVTLIIFLVGAIIFRKLRPHFADVL